MHACTPLTHTVKVNGENATILAHADVARMIGSSPGGVVNLVITPLPLEVLQQAANASAASAPATPAPAAPPAGGRRQRITIPKGAEGMGFNLARVGDQHVFRVVDVGGPAYR
jgi:hypothetical protein